MIRPLRHTSAVEGFLSYRKIRWISFTDQGVKSCFYILYITKGTKAAPSTPAHKHSNEPLETKIVFSKGFHDFLSLISMMRKVVLASCFCVFCQGRDLKAASDILFYTTRSPLNVQARRQEHWGFAACSLCS